MDLFLKIIEKIVDFFPSIITVAAVAGLIILTRWVIGRVYAGKEGLTYKRQIATLVILFIGLIVLLIVLPINPTLRGQLFTLLGIIITALVALSSSNFIGNAMAGLLVRSLHSFRPGDFIKVGELFGRISETGLYHIEVQTIHRDLVTIPNLYIIKNPVTVTQSSGTFISADVSLGYDVERERIEELLIVAAKKTELSDPFVHILKLGDFSVTYRLYGLLEDVKYFVSTESTLKKMMLDELHQAGIEIVSPTFVNRRIVPDEKRYIPQDGDPMRRPQSESQKEKEQGEEVSEIAFDKAEEASTIEELRQKFEETGKEIADTKEQAKAAKDSDSKERLREKIEGLEKKKKHLAEYIKSREEKQKGEG